MNYNAIILLFLIAGCILVYLTAFRKPKKKIFWDMHLDHLQKQNYSEVNMQTHLPQLSSPDRLLQRIHKDLGLRASMIQQSYPYLKRTIEELRELQGKIYLLDNFMEEHKEDPTSRQINEYETYLFDNLWKNQEYTKMDLPTNDRQALTIVNKSDSAKQY